MKKLFVFIALLGCLCGTMFFKIEKNPIFQLDNVEQVCFVSPRDFSAQLPVEAVSSGYLMFNYCSLQTAKENLSKLKQDMQCMQLYFQEINVEELFKKLKADVILTEDMGDFVVIDAYTPYFSDCVYLQNKKVNMQLVIKENQVVVGFPMLLTGY